MAKFRCIHSGNVFVFESEHDIRDLRKHAEYQEVIEQSQEPKVEKVQPAKRTYNKVKSKDE